MHDYWMGKWLTLVVVGALGCGGGKPAVSAPKEVQTDAGERDAATPDARAELAGESGSPAADSGGAGKPDEVYAAGGGGTAATTETGGTPAAGNPAPSGGAGAAAMAGQTAVPMAGAPAPADHVLWSQSWTVAIHPTGGGTGGYQNATMGLAFDAGDLCKFGFSGAASGSAQDFPTDGACITETAKQHLASGSVVIYDSAGMHGIVGGGSAPITGWVEAVTGHTVVSVRRTQTYTIQLLGSGDTSANYADFEGKWEAIGH